MQIKKHIPGKRNGKRSALRLFILFLLFCSVGAFFIDPAYATVREEPAALMAKHTPCVFCPIFRLVVEAGSRMSYMAYTRTQNACHGLMAVGLMLFFGVEALKAFTSVRSFDGGDFWRNILKRVFAVSIAICIILLSPHQAYGLIISPILEGMTAMSVSYLGADAMSSATILTDGGNTVSCSMSTNNSAPAGHAFPQSTQDAIVCAAAAVNFALAKGMVLGIITLIEGILPVFPDFTLLISGLLIVLMYLLLFAILPFTLIDCVLRLGIVGALMPLFITAWAFPLTRWFASKGWVMLTNTFFTMVIVCIVGGFSATMLENVLSQSNSILNILDSGSSMDIARLVAFRVVGVTDPQNAYTCLKLIAVAAISFFLFGKVPAMADHFSGADTSAMGVGAKLAAEMNAGMKQAAKAVEALSMAVPALKPVAMAMKAGTKMIDKNLEQGGNQGAVGAANKKMNDRMEMGKQALSGRRGQRFKGKLDAGLANLKKSVESGEKASLSAFQEGYDKQKAEYKKEDDAKSKEQTQAEKARSSSMRWKTAGDASQHHGNLFMKAAAKGMHKVADVKEKKAQEFEKKNKNNNGE